MNEYFSIFTAEYLINWDYFNKIVFDVLQQQHIVYIIHYKCLIYIDSCSIRPNKTIKNNTNIFVCKHIKQIYTMVCE